MAVRNVKELEVYQRAYALAMEIFKTSKVFPVDERYALTSQIRRSSRSVAMNLREAWLRPVEEYWRRADRIGALCLKDLSPQ
jgi:four helix bundle protein